MTTDWTLAVSVLGAGTGLGLLGVYLLAQAPGKVSKKGGKVPRSGVDAGELADLEAQQEVTLARLRELEAGNTAFSPEAARAERRRLEIDAARALRALEEGARRTKAAGPAAEGKSGGILRHPLPWSIGSAAFAVAIVLTLQQFSGARQSGRPMTGGDSAMAPSSAPMAEPAAAEGLDPSVASLKAQAEKAPGNMEVQLDLGDAYLRTPSGAFEAFQVAKGVLAKDPDNPRALTQMAIVRGEMGMNPASLELTERAVAKDPALVVAWVERGRAALSMGRSEIADVAFAKAKALRPDLASELDELIRATRTKVAGGTPQQEPGAPAGGSAPSPGGDALEGTVEIDPAIAGSLPSGGFIFVAAKVEGSPRPVAAKRLPAQGLPLSFRLGPEDAVMGGTIPARVNLEARWDADGNAFTREPTDPIARVPNVAVGTKGLRLVLKAP